MHHLKPFLSYLPCKVCREYFSIIFIVKKCTLYSIMYNIPLLPYLRKTTQQNTNQHLVPLNSEIRVKLFNFKLKTWSKQLFRFSPVRYYNTYLNHLDLATLSKLASIMFKAKISMQKNDLAYREKFLLVYATKL
jgi:hypothetical protein